MNVVLRWLDRGGLLLSLLVLIVVFSLVNSSFLTKATMLDIIDQNAALAIVAAGLLVVVISGGLDLSVGALSAFSGMVMAQSFAGGMDPMLALVLGILLGCAVGIAQGFLISVIGVNSVIVTLAGLIWARGLATAISGGQSVPVDLNLTLNLTNRHLGWFSNLALVVLAVYALVAITLRATKLGRYIYAQGGSRKAARQAGLPVWRIGVIVFAISGALAGLAGCLEAGRLGVAGPTLSTGLELDAIAAVILGGARLSGGDGVLSRTMVGVVFIATMNSGLSLLGLADPYVYLYKGLIVLLALSLEVAARRFVRDEPFEIQTSTKPESAEVPL